MDNITTTTDKMTEFSDFIEVAAIDMFIPIEGISFEEQKERINNCKCTIEGSTEYKEAFDNAIYYRADNGLHGLHCANCGAVLQWG